MSLADRLEAEVERANPSPRILTIDIENSPHTLYGWGLFNQNFGINQIETAGDVICFAAKWLGERDVMFFSDHHDGHDVMVKAAWDLLSEADIVIGYNSDRFDLTKLNWAFERAGLGRPRQYKTVDLLKVARREFGHGPASKKLDYVVQSLGLGAKIHHEGMPLWIACMGGDPKAWDRMRRYNIGDVRITERLYHRWRPWIRNHPNMQLIVGDDKCCPTCTGKRLKRDGEVSTALTVYPAYLCLKCGARMRSNYVMRRVSTRTVA